MIWKWSREDAEIFRSGLRITWLQEGNRISTFFHGYVSGRKKSQISSTELQEAALAMEKKIAGAFVSIYLYIYAKECWIKAHSHTLCPSTIYSLMSLEKAFNWEEIKEVVFKLVKDKHQGQQGFLDFILRSSRISCKRDASSVQQDIF